MPSFVKTKRQYKIIKIKIDTQILTRMIIGVLLAIIGLLLGWIFFREERPFLGIGYLENLYTEGVGMLITIAVIDVLANYREKQRQIREEKARLLRQITSETNSIALEALDQIRQNNWLTGTVSLLKDKRLRRAKLENADLSGTNLEGVDFSLADLKSVSFTNATLSNVDMQATTLVRAILDGQNLTTVRLQGADLTEARLTQANLQFNDLRDVRLGGAVIIEADMQYTRLMGSDLRFLIGHKINLIGADLTDANLINAQLNGADLTDAILDGADLYQADLTDVIGLESAHFTSRTILPSATFIGVDDKGINMYTPDSFWSENTDIQALTNKNSSIGLK